MAIDYPAGLPVPQTSVISPIERRALSNEDLPREARARSRDRLQFERATWVMTDAQANLFRSWWETDLTDGAAWFNATWPVPEGLVEKQHCFRTQPAYAFIPGGFWKISAILEVRGRGRRVDFGLPSPAAAEIAWFYPIGDSVTGSLAHSNSGTGVLDSFAAGPTTELYAGLVGWVDEVLVWSIASWTSVDGHPSPTIIDSADRWVHIGWINTDTTGWPIYDPSIGTLVLTATVDGDPIATGQRLVAVSTPATVDYPSIAWEPE